MRVVHLSTHESAGGAARAARTLHDALVAAGVDSRMVVRDRISADRRITEVTVDPAASRLAREIERRWIVSERSPGTDTFFSAGLAGTDVARHAEVLAADILHLHWIAGLLDAPAIGALLALGKPVAWTLHDEWPFTGGCHFTAGCERWRDRCDACPQLRRDPLGLVPAHFGEKRRHFDRGPMTLVSPSRWLAERAAASGLLGGRPLRIIPYGVDLGLFSPVLREEGRRRFGLDPGDAAILFNADATGERRKGLVHLEAALRQLGAGGIRPRLIALGDSAGVDLPAGSIRTGRLSDRRTLAAIVAACDLTVVPSLEDNLPNSVLESLACGTPVVAYATGGIPEALEGIELLPCLVPAGDTAALAGAVREAICDLDRLRSLRGGLRELAERRFDPARIADAHERLYADLLARAEAVA